MRGRTSKCLVCISNNVQRHHSGEQMNHHRRRSYTYYLRIHVCGYMIKRLFLLCRGLSSELEMSRISIGNVMSAFSDDLKPFCAPASQILLMQLKISIFFFASKRPQGVHNTSDILVWSGVVFNLSTCLRSFLLHQH